MNKLKALWARLPHPVQAGIVTFIGAAGATITHAIEEGRVPNTWADWKHLVGTAVVAGLIALKAFYMLPSNGTAQLVQAAKAQQQFGANPPSGGA